MVNQKLFVEFLRVYAFQPATAFWRAVEVDVLRKYIPSAGTCVDLGCGDGKLTKIMFHKAFPGNLTLIGVDVDKQETVEAANLPIYARVHTGSASAIPEETGSVDHVISNSVLEHIQDIEATIKEAGRLVKSGGTFVFTVPGPDFHHCLYGPYMRKVARQMYLQEIDKRLVHYRYWGVDRWTTVLAEYDFTVEKHEEYFDCIEVRRWETISRLTGGVFYALSGRRHTPFELQKRSGLRGAQNKLTLPQWLASFLALILSSNLNGKSDKYGCLLIAARKI